jgi:arylsulfatase A-like enzyme
VGKWHLGGPGHYPEDHGFGVNIGGSEDGWPRGGYFSPYQNRKLPDGPKGEYLTDRLTDEAIGLIRGNTGAPFFLNLWHYAVHTPIQAPPDLVEKYRRKAERTGLDRVKALEEGERFPFLGTGDRRIVRRLVQSDPVYAAMVENLDANVGRLLATLEETGRADDTVVFFHSDNGGLATAEGSPTTNRPLNEGKGWMYEGGTREPLLVRWPGRIAPGSRCAVPVTSTDFYPTMLEMAGLPALPDQHRDGISIVPLLQGGDRLDREAIFWHYPHYSNQGGSPGCSLRCGDWKLIEFFEDGKLELYNLREDVGEEHDRANSEPALVRRLHGMLVAWRDSVRAKIPEPNPEYDAEKAGS